MDRPSASKKAKVEDSPGILMERKRRGKMGNLYSELQSMVPNLIPKATRTSVIDGTISYIQELEHTMKELEARKAGQLNAQYSSLQTLNTSSINMTVSGRTAFFGIRLPSRTGLATSVIRVFEAHKTEVLSSSITRDEEGLEMTMMVTAVVNGGGEISEIKKDLLMCLS